MPIYGTYVNINTESMSSIGRVVTAVKENLSQKPVQMVGSSSVSVTAPPQKDLMATRWKFLMVYAEQRKVSSDSDTLRRLSKPF